MINKPTLSILVLNYNGINLLKQCFPSVITAARNSILYDTQVILVDNCSYDGSEEWIATKFPEAFIVRNPVNQYLFTLNTTAEEIDSDYLLFLNNDVILETDSLEPLIDPLIFNSQVFSITPLLLKPDHRSLDAGKRWGEFRRGFLHHDTLSDIKTLAPTLFPTGGAFIVSRLSFLRIGGFDRLYYPAYWEDIDLGYRAWKQGLSNLFQPSSIMYHMKRASWGRENQDYVRWMELRNSWLFVWKNVTQTSILAKNAFWTIRYYLSALKRHDCVLKKAIEAFIQCLPKIARYRQKELSQNVWGDERIINLSSLNNFDILLERTRNNFCKL
jgi:N-acetylglucosaminyl-diphospho-decaprenol L-rhamnosyltransferase